MSARSKPPPSTPSQARLAATQLRDLVRKSSRPSTQARSPSRRPLVHALRGRVLVIDDQPAVAAAIRRLLATEHEAMMLTRAADALPLLARGERFHAIVCDLMMPGFSGADLFLALARDYPEQAARVIFLTGGAYSAEMQAFLGGNQNPRVMKPFEGPKLRELVRAVVAIETPLG